MTSNVLCKYYAAGCCMYGSDCRFSHVKADAPSEVCKFYLQGSCAYGDRCRYQHVKPGWSAAGQAKQAPSKYSAPPAVPRPPIGPGAVAASSSSAPAADDPSRGVVRLPSGADEFGLMESNDPNPDWNEYMDPEEMEAWEAYMQEEQEGGWYTEEGIGLEGYPSGDSLVDPADIPLCSEYASQGTCHRGDNCQLVHGDECEVCHKMALHPYNPQQQAEHAAECATRQQQLERWRQSRDVECSICMEKVLSNPDPTNRKFGLLACEHPFCLPCIRGWRQTGEADTETAVRTCPLCRQPSHFITPSRYWPQSAGEKADIQDRYRAKLATVDCMHFDFGNGTCPFGTSCFYKHAYRDGRLEEVHLRKAANEDGEVRVVAPVTLASFLDTPQAQRMLSGRGARGRR